MKDLGLVHMYIGDGKGKTTASVGLAVRARGAGANVCVAQFLKGRDSAEIGSLKQLGIDHRRTEGIVKFVFAMDEKEKAECKGICTALLSSVAADVAAGAFDLVVLDEVIDAVGLGMVEENDLARLLETKGETEIVITGRNPSERLKDLSDYITEMKAHKHPYEKGIPARRAIEF